MHEFDVTATISLFLSLFLFGGKEVVWIQNCIHANYITINKRWQITNPASFVFITFLVFKLLSCKEFVEK